MIRNFYPWHCNTGRVVRGNSYDYYQHFSQKNIYLLFTINFLVYLLDERKCLDQSIANISPSHWYYWTDCLWGNSKCFHYFVSTPSATYYTSDLPVLRHNFHLYSLTDVILAIDICDRDS